MWVQCCRQKCYPPGFLGFEWITARKITNQFQIKTALLGLEFDYWGGGGGGARKKGNGAERAVMMGKDLIIFSICLIC